MGVSEPGDLFTSTRPSCRPASRSPLAKEGELTHAVAGNSKNLAGMAKNAKVAASGKQGGMKGGYL